MSLNGLEYNFLEEKLAHRLKEEAKKYIGRKIKIKIM